MINSKAGRYSLPLIILGLLLFLSCSGSEEQDQGVAEKQISVKAELVGQSNQKLVRNFTGTLEGEKQAVISSKIAEAVDEIVFGEGQTVKAGQVLVSLDQTGPTSSFMQTKSLFQNAEKHFNKMKFLYKQGAVSEMEYDGAKTGYEVARANFEAARRLIDIRTPIDGLVTSIDVSPGDYLYPGQTVATVASVEKLRINLGVSSDDITYFDVGDEVDVSVQSSMVLTGRGRVNNVSRSADPVTRTFQVEVEVDNAENIFKPGMFARAEITIAKFDNIITVPRSSVINRDDQNQVFIAANGIAKIKTVELGIEFTGLVQVKSGLSVSDTLITVGQNYLDDGYKIKLAHFDDSNGKEIEP